MVPDEDVAFTRFATACAFVAGAGAVAFTTVFVWIVIGAPHWVGGLWMLLLVLGELLGIVVLVGLWQRLRDAEPMFAMLALLLGLAGAMGGIAHGGQQLEEIVKPPPHAASAYIVELDPRGIFRYAVSGLALLLLGWLVLRAGKLPRRLAWLTVVSGALLVVIYLGRLTVEINPAHRLTLTPPLLYRVVVNP